MGSYIRNRILLEAEHILQTGDTLRNTAKLFGVSKSTVHLDMSKRLKKISLDKFLKISQKLCYNFSQKHIRGGLATAQKYKTKTNITQK